MARLWQSGFELNSTTAGVEFVTFTSTTVSTIHVRNGSYAMRANPSATTQNTLATFSSTDVSKTYVRFYLYIATMPTGGIPDLIQGRTSTANSTTGIKLSTSGALQLYNLQGGVQLGSDSSPLSTGTWYRVELFTDMTTRASTTVTAKIDGVQFATGTADLTAVGVNGSTGFRIGAVNFNSTCDLYFDDIAVNDDSGSFQNSYPGAGAIIHLKPSAAGDVNTFVTQTGGTVGSANNYTRVNEVTPDDATTFNGSTILGQEDLFNVDDSGIGSSDTVNVVAIGARFRNSIADAVGAIRLEVEKTSAGTISQSSDIIPNSTTWNTNASGTVHGYPITLYQDPDASNWTQATLDSMQIGYKYTIDGVQRIDVSTVWASVDFTPAAATTTSTSSTSTSSTSSSTSISTSSTSTSSTSSSTSQSTSTSSTSTSLSTSSTSTSVSVTTSTSSTSQSTSSTSTSVSFTTSTSSTSSSTSLSTSTSSTSSSTSRSTSTSSTSASTSLSTSTSSTSSSTSLSTSTSSTSTSRSTSTSSTSGSTSKSTSTSSTSQSTSTTLSTTTSTSTSSTSSSTSSTTTLPLGIIKPAIKQTPYTQTIDPNIGYPTSLMDGTALMDDPTATMGQPPARIEREIRLRPQIFKGRIRR